MWVSPWLLPACPSSEVRPMLFKNANIFTAEGKFVHGSFRVEDGKFTEILNTVPSEDGLDLENAYVIPGLIDVHNHGNSGADFSDGDYGGFEALVPEILF